MSLRLAIFVLFYTLLIIAGSGQCFSAYADTPLDSSNWFGTTGDHWWYIDEPGSYYLDVKDQIFSTTHNHAIRIACSNVVLDGRGKTITGAGPPASISESGSDVYGVRVNAGGPSSGIQIMNLNVEKKFFGIIFEAVADGVIDKVNATNNNTGIYLWDTDNNTISNNSSNSNLHSGIVLDGDNCINTGNTFSNNTTSGNEEFGILLWLICPNSTLTGNIVNNNGNSAIALSSGCDGSTLTGNMTGYNANGIHVKSSNNTINSNTLTYNTNVGLWIESSNNNKITNNLAGNNKTAGIWLTSSGTNSLVNNTCDSNLGHGIVLNANSSNNTLTSNAVSSNAEVGIALLSGSNSNTVTGHTVNTNSIGITISNSDSNTIADNTLANNQNNGLFIELSSGNSITGNQITGSQNAGIWLSSSTNNTFFSNSISNHKFWGIFLNSSNEQTIYNNNFNNPSGNAGFAGSNKGNVWNITKAEGQNIVGGPFLGGNFWGKPDGTEFSQVTEDSDGDGICDSANTLASGNVDELPLHTYSAATELYVNQDDPTCGGKPPCFTEIQSAINFAGSQATIRIAQGIYNETAALAEAKEITIDGSWNSSFTDQTPNTTIIKPPVAGNTGSMTFLNLIIRP